MKTIKLLLPLTLALSLNHVHCMNNKRTLDTNNEKQRNEKKSKVEDVNEELLQECNKKNQNLEQIKLLIEKNADINHKNNLDNSSLHCACINTASLEIIKHLIENNAHIDSKNKWGNNPLHLACRYNTSPEIIKYFIEKKTDIKSKNNQQYTPLHWACNNSSLENIKVLIASFIDTKSIFTYLCCSKSLTKKIKLIMPKPITFIIFNEVFKNPIQDLKNYINMKNTERKTAFDIVPNQPIGIINFFNQLFRLLNGKIEHILSFWFIEFKK